MKKNVAIIALTFASAVFAADADAFNDGVDRSDPNFVKASLVVTSPGEQLFSCAGHACLRLECPTFKLDNCYSYESEDVRDRVLTFFAGKLKMGMFSIPTPVLLGFYADEGRGVRQYALNLPPEIKQRLWKVLDERVAQGVNIPYDYVSRGCAWSVLGCLSKASKPLELEPGLWPEKFKMSRREILADAVAEHPWKRFVHQAIIGADVDREEKPEEKVILPSDLVEFLQNARIAGQPVLAKESEELLPVAVPPSATPWFTPVIAAILLVILATVNLWLKKPVLDWFFLLMQTVAGAFFTYLVVFSDLPATNWNWQLVPFNLLPLVFWKWRRRWAIAFAGVLTVWEAGMLLSPHRLTDPAYLVIVLAYIVFYLKIALQGKCLSSVSKNVDREEGGCV